MTDPKLKLFTLDEVAELCHVPVGTVRYWRSMGKLKVIKPGRCPLVLEEDLLMFLGITQQNGKFVRTQSLTSRR